MSSIDICLVTQCQPLHLNVKLETILGKTFAIFESFVNRTNWAPTFMPPKKALGMLFQGLIFRRICFTNSPNAFLPFSHNICFIPVSGNTRNDWRHYLVIWPISHTIARDIFSIRISSQSAHKKTFQNYSEGLSPKLGNIFRSLLPSKIIVRWSNHVLETFTTIIHCCDLTLNVIFDLSKHV